MVGTRVFAVLVLSCFVWPGARAYAQGATDPVDVVLDAVPTPPIAFVGITPFLHRGDGFPGDLRRRLVGRD